MDIRNFQFKKIQKEVWQDESKEALVNSPQEIDRTVLTNSKKKQADRQAWDRINSNVKRMFGNDDGDRFLNVLDKQPHKKNKKRFNIKKFI